MLKEFVAMKTWEFIRYTLYMLVCGCVTHLAIINGEVRETCMVCDWIKPRSDKAPTIGDVLFSKYCNILQYSYLLQYSTIRG